MPKRAVDPVTRFADMLSAMGTETRLSIMRLLLSADPDGLVVGEIQEKLAVPASTLSHHLDKLRNERLVTSRREGTFLRYAADWTALRELLGFLYTECCSHGVVKPGGPLSKGGTTSAPAHSLAMGILRFPTSWPRRSE